MMRRVNALLYRADARFREWLLARPQAWLLALLNACVLLGFALIMLTRALGALPGAGILERLPAVLLLCAPLYVMLHAACAAGKSRGDGLFAHALLAVVCAAAMLARVSFIDHVSSDYDIYLSDWLSQFASRTFAQSMRENIGEYNVLYQYILFLITRLPVPPLYAVKAVSFIGDAFLASAAAQLAGRDGRKSTAALCAVLLLPVCVLNGGMFAQCDSLYAACALWGLAHALSGRPAKGAACFALSIAFKLQAAFILPIVAVLYAGRRLRLADALVFLLALLACAVPALLGGKSLGQILAIYTGQTGLYTGLTYNAPTLFGLMNTCGLDVYAYGNFGMALALGAALALLCVCVPRALGMDEGAYLRLALLLVLAVVFLLPRMHERYFFMADILAVALAAKDGRYTPAAGLIALASLSRYLDMGLPLFAASAMMLAALLMVLHTGKSTCEKQKPCV